LHLISQWFVEEKLSHAQIAYRIRKWVEKNAPDCYDPDPQRGVSTQFVGRRIAEDAQKYRFLRVSPFYEEELAQKITRALFLERVELFVAPNYDEMLRYIWLDLDRFLTDRIKNGDATKALVIGVSGGGTMIDLARISQSLPDMTMHEKISTNIREKITVCSLTSGGIRSNTGALSDTVAAIIAGYLGAKTWGLLGPAWFADKSALTAFCNDQDVQESLRLVNEAEIILSSVGYLGEQKSFMRQLLERAGELKYVEDHPNLSDILCNCYDGLSGESIELPERIRDHVFSVINIQQLRDKIHKGSRCIVLAGGKLKGYHSIIGVLRKQMASHVYIDKDCAEAVLEALH
jgi:DNA-binding transcriptional regulator LsrR (DeoR family)